MAALGAGLFLMSEVPLNFIQEWLDHFQTFVVLPLPIFLGHARMLHILGVVRLAAPERERNTGVPCS